MGPFFSRSALCGGLGDGGGGGFGGGDGLGSGGVFEGGFDDLAHVFHQNTLQVRKHVFGHIVEVDFVAFGQDHPGDSCAMSGEDLGLDSTHRKHTTSQGAFSRHGRIRTDLTAGQQGRQSREDRDSSGRTVFGNGSRWDVDMKVSLLQELRRNAQLFCAATDVGESRTSGFLHDVSKLSCDLEIALACHGAGLDEEDIPAHRCPCKSRGDAGKRSSLDHPIEELGLA